MSFENLNQVDIRTIDWSTKPGISYTFSFELIQNIDSYLESLGSNFNLWIAASLLYIVTIFYLQHEMKSRKPYSLRIPLILWNLGLTIFSAATVARLGPDLIENITSKGVFASFCDASSFHSDPRVKTWIWFFSLSKLVEFGDTIFVVLRKQPLIFLHWFHHATTLLYCMYSIGLYLPAYTRWFMAINAGIHTIMYGYYAARAARFKFPRIVNMSITSLQIIQMVAGLAINAITFYHQRSNRHCDGHQNASIAGFAIYLSFLFLFCHFFISSYLKPRDCKNDKSKMLNNNNDFEISKKSIKPTKYD